MSKQNTGYGSSDFGPIDPSGIDCSPLLEAHKRNTEPKHDDGPWIVIIKKGEETPIAFVVRDIGPAQSIANNYIERNAETTATIIPVKQALASKALLDACKSAMSHISELRDAWQRGSLSDCDGQGGLRSNRNVDVQTTIRAAIALTE